MRLVNQAGRYIFSKSIMVRWSDEAVVPVFIYPNPVREELRVEFNAEKSGNISFEVINTNGQVLHSGRHMLTMGFNRFTIGLKHFVPGVYFIRWSEQGVLRYNRFVKI